MPDATQALFKRFNQAAKLQGKLRAESQCQSLVSNSLIADRRADFNKSQAQILAHNKLVKASEPIPSTRR